MVLFELIIMIELTRLNKQVIFLNPDLIKLIEETPDTVISLINGDHLLVLEKAAEIIEKIIDYRIGILRRSGNPNGLFGSPPCSSEK